MKAARHIVGIGLAAGASIGLAHAAAADAPPQTIEIHYRMAVWAIPFGQLDYTGTFGSGRYSAAMHFRTSGFLGSFWKSAIDNSASGIIAANALLPSTYVSQSVSHSGRRQWLRVDYPRNAAPVMHAEPPYDVSRFPVTDNQKRGAVDPVTGLSALVAGLQTDDLARCARPLAIFDGRRRYNIVFAQREADDAGATPPASGTQRCTVRYEHIAGLKQEVVDLSTDPPPIYADLINLAAPDAPRGHYTLARKAWAAFWWGQVSATVTEVKIDGRTVPLHE
ncbi:MAG: DUF3108 domain-containing protein [Alphaproteobacteria bacterium]